MVDSDLGSYNSIEWYQQLQNIIVSINQQVKHMNNAWKSKIDYGHIHEEDDSVLPILGVWRLESGCNLFLAMSGMCFNAFCALKSLLGMKSVFNFL